MNEMYTFARIQLIIRFFVFISSFIYRAQSVRRTSLRDKTLTTKKDAVEETRLRLQAQEVSNEWKWTQAK